MLELYFLGNFLMTIVFLILATTTFIAATRFIKKSNRTDYIISLAELDAIFKVCHKKGLDPERALKIAKTIEATEDHRIRENKSFHEQMKERETYKYPPIYHLIEITVKHKDYNITNMASKTLVHILRPYFKSDILGPENPIINRIKSFKFEKLFN